MSVKTYNLNYDYFEAEAVFKVDTDIFTNDHAKATLEFFTWDYDKDEDPILEVIKKYGMEVITIATNYSYNVKGVIKEFDNKEGFAKIDGSYGITLISANGYVFDENKLTVTIK